MLPTATLLFARVKPLCCQRGFRCGNLLVIHRRGRRSIGGQRIGHDSSLHPERVLLVAGEPALAGNWRLWLQSPCRRSGCVRRLSGRWRTNPLGPQRLHRHSQRGKSARLGKGKSESDPEPDPRNGWNEHGLMKRSGGVLTHHRPALGLIIEQILDSTRTPGCME